MTDDDLRRAYLTLLKRALNGYLQLGGADDVARYFPLNERTYDREASAWRIPEETRPHTVLPVDRLDTLERLMRRVLAEGIPGDLIEAGVHRGGVIVFMRAFLDIHGCRDRKVWAADTFEGIPPPRQQDAPRDVVNEWRDRWVAGYEGVRATFARYGVLDRGVELLRGAFIDTLPTAPIGRLALVRLDADAYESTLDALTHLYPRISPGGFVIIDDHHLPGCIQAVREYRARHRIESPLQGAFVKVDGRDELRELFWQV